MKNYRKTSHSVYDIKYHLVWITKYRKPMLAGGVATRLRELIREICKTMDIEIIKGHVSKDHVHLFVSVPPYHSVSQVMKRIKCWGRHRWARGYFVASSGNVTDEVIAEYIEKQTHTERARDDDFTVDS
jgi:putative transposase